MTPCFDYVWNFSEGLARFRVGEKIGFIDLAGKIAIEPSFDCAWEFAEGLAPVQIDGSWGFITEKEGQFSIEPAFYSAHCFSLGTAEVEDWEGPGPYRIDRTGARVSYVDTKENPISERGPQLERAYRAGLWGFEGRSGKLGTRLLYSKASVTSQTGSLALPMKRAFGDTSIQKERLSSPFHFLDCRDFVLVDKENA